MSHKGLTVATDDSELHILKTVLRNLSSKEVIKNDKCDTPSPSTKPSLTKQRVQSASDKLDSELEATEAETKAVLADLRHDPLASVMQLTF